MASTASPVDRVEDSFNLTHQIFKGVCPCTPDNSAKYLRRVESISRKLKDNVECSPLTKAFMDQSNLKSRRIHQDKRHQKLAHRTNIESIYEVSSQPGSSLDEAILCGVDEFIPENILGERPAVYGASSESEGCFTDPFSSLPLGPRPSCVGQELSPIASRTQMDKAARRTLDGTPKSALRSIGHKFKTFQKHMRSTSSIHTLVHL